MNTIVINHPLPKEVIAIHIIKDDTLYIVTNTTTEKENQELIKKTLECLKNEKGISG